jgi:antirestriction protein ArdC
MLWAEATMKGFAAPIWMTFKQALELNACVRKGEKGSLVVCANSNTRTETDSDSGKEAERDIHYMKGYTVFNVEQIDGLPAQYYWAYSDMPSFSSQSEISFVLTTTPRRGGRLASFRTGVSRPSVNQP